MENPTRVFQKDSDMGSTEESRIPSTYPEDLLEDLIFEDELACFVLKTLRKIDPKHQAMAYYLGEEWLRLDLLHRVIPDFPIALQSRRIPDEAHESWASVVGIFRRPGKFLFETGVRDQWKQHVTSSDDRPCGMVISTPGLTCGTIIHDAWKLVGEVRIPIRMWTGRGYHLFTLDLFAPFVRRLAKEFYER